MNQKHPTAFVDPQARLAGDVEVGPLCYVGPGVELGEGCRLHPHVTLLGPAQFGRRNTFFPHCTIGAAPQDLKYRGGPTSVVVGDDNTFRENVTIHRGTEIDPLSGGVTRIGNKNLMMVGVHLAHDVQVGNHVILANSVQVAGHVNIEDCVNVGGVCAMHHFVTVGRNAFIGGMTRVRHDVPPFMKVQGYEQEVRGANTEGLRRWHFSEETIRDLRRAARLLYARRGGRTVHRTLEAIEEIRGNGLIDDPHVRHLVECLQRKMEIGVFGRVREHTRVDTHADRGAFYQDKLEGSKA